jgi:hypothetical protein
VAEEGLEEEEEEEAKELLSEVNGLRLHLSAGRSAGPKNPTGVRGLFPSRQSPSTPAHTHLSLTATPTLVATLTLNQP